jgi:beta-lactamase regulating signal transducer with metallopeptidase domain
MIAALPLAELLLAVWLGGAGVVLWRRFAAYFSLRGALLAEGREVGRVRARIGWVRLVETPATAAPLAMGVLDPVIALPPGFLALYDRPARDLALAHELAHHRGGDLIVNVLVQPLFALHWWSPLGRYGWLALRRDQEAACDARVMARCGGVQRAAYAALIARFAAAPGSAHHAALTAPMACPVLGEKSIIHRLRSLAMSDLSPRRRLAGRALLGAGLLALPLTATVTYAASESVLEAPQPPEPPAPPEPPQPPEPPLPPEPPQPPEPPAMTAFDPDTDAAMQDAAEQGWHEAAEAREAHARAMEGYHAGMAAHQEALASMNEALAEAERVRAEIPRMVAEAMAEAEAARASGAGRVIVRQECRPGSEEVSETTTADGTQVVSICQKRIFASARRGLEEARAEIASDPDMPEYARKQVLRSLDRQIAAWRESES